MPYKVSKEEMGELKKHIDSDVTVITQFVSILFTENPKLDSEFHIGIKNGCISTITDEDIRDAKGVCILDYGPDTSDNTSYFGKLRDVRHDAILLEDTWISFMSDIRSDENVPGEEMYGSSMIIGIREDSELSGHDGELFFYKEANEYLDHTPDDIRKKQKKYMQIMR